MNRTFVFFVLTTLTIALAACGSASEGEPAPDSEPTAPSAEVSPAAGEATQASGRMGMGPGGGMMARHHAAIPEAYAGMSNPVEAGEDSLARGSEIYTSNCAVCHGDGGMGDGPGGASLDPAPAPIAHTSQMLGDDYLFWRLSEGGAMEPFNSAMVAWKDVLDEGARWDVINYVRALGSGQVEPGQGMGGAVFDPAVEAANQAEMLARGVEEGLISQEEADLFAGAHIKVDEQMARMRAAGASEGMDELMDEILAALVAAGELSQDQADTFLSVHDRLGQAGLMQ